MNSFVRNALYAMTVCAVSSQMAHAQQAYTTFSNPLNPVASHEAPNVAPASGMPPPIGDGATPRPEIPGDTEPPPPVPTGKADTGTGSRFDTVPGDTNRPPILVLGKRHGDQVMQYTENYGPSPGYEIINGRKYIYADAPAAGAGYFKDPNKFKYGGLPTVQKLSRYFVILAVVAATIFMAFAAYGVVIGEQDAGARVIHTAGGLMLLLMAFTIWKVLQANMVSLDDEGPWDANNHKLPHHILLPEALPKNAGPQGPARPARSGVPVLP